ncbi:MAG TPA: phosphonate ABC transporter, permease protein PhnE [Thermoanaerobaculaceae bacterium]|nr:phosphonate ABC transporter, permease protein PhnE [Thermoanaerobaculaceae bacterium]HRS17784.1 phosphonate ABC transporter, permease protein PhnE [Thermoanaerobaculaceae bacterium]
MSSPTTDISGVRKAVLRLQTVLLDTTLITTLLLMVELQWVAFSGKRGGTGLLMTAEEILKNLSYGTLALVAFVAATAWNLFYRDIGCSPGRAWVRGEPEWERDLPWHHTLRGWFIALFIELSFFTGWLITEVDLGTFLTKFGKAWDIIRGLLHPSGSVLEQGLILLVQTVFLAFMATAFAIPAAFLISFLAARNLTRHSAIARLAYTLTRTVMNFVRAVEPLVWALIFISWVGIGPFAGVLALWITSIASLVKLYSESIESIDTGPMDAIAATGASYLQVLRYGVVPQVIPPFLSFTIYRWDINVRMSTIIGFVGGGGIGYILKPRVDLGEWGEVGTLVLLIALTVWLMDVVSAKIRERIV